MKKAFTLIELLGVLIILAVIALITFPIIDNLLTSSRQQAYQRSVEGILEAAKLYVTGESDFPSNDIKKIDLQTLINSGLLEDKDIIDPRNNEDMIGCILYKWDDSNNQYQYSYEENPDNCLVATESDCFNYQNIEIAESFDINYDNCISFFSDSYNVEELCTNTNMLKSEIFLGEVSLEELITANVISNYRIKDGVVITDYFCEGDVVIPSSISSIPVIGIASESFQDSNLNSVNFSLATDLIFIESGGFYRTSLSNIVFKNNLDLIYIGEGAFSSNNLVNVDISSLTNLWYIGRFAFCSNPIQSIKGVNEFQQNYFSLICSH